MTTEDNSPGGYKQYQEWFTTRKVGAANHGVPDFEEEIRGLVEDVENVPWQRLDENERIAVSGVATDTLALVCDIAMKEGEIDSSTGTSVIKHVSMLIASEMLGVDTAFAGPGLEMALADDLDDYSDGE